MLYVLKHRRAAWMFALCVPFLAGFFYFHLHANIRDSLRRIPYGHEAFLKGTVSEEPRLQPKSQYVTLSLAPPHRGTVGVLLPRATPLLYGDSVTIRGTVEPPPAAWERPLMRFPEVEVHAHGAGSWVKEKLIAAKHSLIEQFTRTLSRDESALMAGLTLGWQGDFTEHFKRAMVESGTTHLVALSGYNVAVLAITLAAACAYVLGRRATFGLTACAIALFVLMTGAQASLARAAAMGFLMLLAKEVGRPYSARNAIAFAATAMALYEPAIVRFDIGFQLSFSSLLGIIYLEPRIRKLLGIRDAAQGFLKWKASAATTLSAQLAVAPLLLYHFGRVSPVALVSNILVLATVPVTMLLGFLLGAGGLLAKPLGFLFSIPARGLLSYQIAVINLFANRAAAYALSAAAALAVLTSYLLSIRKRHEQ
jgi:competence protein ComEC